jgi:hypothetical protein
MYECSHDLDLRQHYIGQRSAAAWPKKRDVPKKRSSSFLRLDARSVCRNASARWLIRNNKWKETLPSVFHRRPVCETVGPCWLCTQYAGGEPPVKPRACCAHYVRRNRLRLFSGEASAVALSGVQPSLPRASQMPRDRSLMRSPFEPAATVLGSRRGTT